MLRGAVLAAVAALAMVSCGVTAKACDLDLLRLQLMLQQQQRSFTEFVPVQRSQIDFVPVQRSQIDFAPVQRSQIDFVPVQREVLELRSHGFSFPATSSVSGFSTVATFPNTRVEAFGPRGRLRGRADVPAGSRVEVRRGLFGPRVNVR